MKLMNGLLDRFGRIHTYLRISLTERCNMQCSYCIPEDGLPGKPPNALPSAAEILQMAEVFIRLGITKIRLTGGEPLLYPQLPEILKGLSGRVEDLAISTNGILLDRHWEHFHQSGLRHINISLDSLDAAAFRSMTKSGQFDRIMENLREALRQGFQVKVNAVLIRGENEQQAASLASLTLKSKMSVRFIEFMPFHRNGWQAPKVQSTADTLSVLKQHFELEKIPDKASDTDRKYRIPGAAGDIDFISTITEPFCTGCNRLRLTADGKLKNCLFARNETNLLQALRAGENLEELIRKNLQEKYERTGGQQMSEATENRSMIRIGG